MQDSITILSHATNKLAKTWRADGSVLAYDLAKQFMTREERVGNIHELSALLAKLNDAPRSCIIRGKRIAEGTDKVFRRLDSFADQPLHSVLIEVDAFEPLLHDAVHEPVEAAQEFITSCLPAPFHGASFHWQLSNSAGHPSKLGKLKAHLWFWLAEPATSAQLKKWAVDAELACDKAVFNPVQVHYTAAPVFEPGVADPVPMRFGFHQGEHDAVIIAMPEVAEGERRVRQRGVVGERASDDPVAQALYDKGMVLDDRTAGVLHIVCPFDADHSPGSAVSSTSYFLRDTGGFEQGHFKCLHDSCVSRTDDDFLRALGLGVENDFEVVVHEDKAVVEMPKLSRTGTGAIKKTLPNLVAMLDCPEHFGVQVRYDSFYGRVMISPHGQHAWRPYDDVDGVRLRERFEKLWGVEGIGKDLMNDAVVLVARSRQFDTAQHWLDSLKWDGVPRIERFFPDYFGVADSAYSRAVSLYVWTALAGRVIQPGVQADMVPVLVGGQGVGKSTGVKALVPDSEFYAEIDIAARDADQSRLMRGKLVGEISELRNWNKIEKEAIKAFVTRTTEEWVEKYDRFTTVMPRRLVFIATTNQSEFLDDDTGNRRWLPMVVGKVDVAAVRRDCLQLWAEGAEMFRLVGVDWSAERMAGEAHEEHSVNDVWVEAIRRYLDTPDQEDGTTPAMRNAVRVSEILQHALQFDLKHVKKADEMRTASALRQLGFVSKKIRVGGEQTRVWSKKWYNVTT